MNIDEMNRINWWHSIDLGNGVITPGKKGGCKDIRKHATTEYGMPQDLTGKTVLDIGTWDGGYAFEAERRGASKVVAIDINQNKEYAEPNAGFVFAHKALKSEVLFMPLSVNDMRFNEQFDERFDVVLFYGVLYHLDDMFGAIQNIRRWCKGICLCETAVTINPILRGSTVPIAEFGHGYGKDNYNRWYPNEACIRKMAIDAGFKAMSNVHDAGPRCTYRFEV